ncbi:MAG TPA: ATP-binding protein [Acidimicrobiales bacterium]|nr:ATP-binding protein [Acidimicrobiales bacterium]
MEGGAIDGGRDADPGVQHRVLAEGYDELDSARRWLEECCARRRVDPATSRDLGLALVEVVTNIVPRSPGNDPARKVELQLDVSDSEVSLTVVSPTGRFRPDPGDEDGGLGMLLVHVLVDEVRGRSDSAESSVLTLVKRR